MPGSSGISQVGYSNMISRTQTSPKYVVREPVIMDMKPVGFNVRAIPRNGACPCGSGKKYKNCCWKQRVPRLEPLTNPDCSIEIAFDETADTTHGSHPA